MHPQFMFFIFVFLIYTLANSYIFFRSYRALPKSKNIRIIFSTVYLFLFSAFIIAMLGRNTLPVTIQKVLYFPGTVWLGMMLYILMFFLIADIIYLLNRFIKFLPAKIKDNYRKIQVYSTYIFVICLAIYGYYQYRNPKVVEKNIHIAKTADDYKRLKVVGVSDFHLGVANDNKRLEQFVKLINAQNPDLIIYAGDLVDNNVLPLEKERMWETINKLEAPLGAYFCLGNHEYLSGGMASLDFLRKTNVNLLVDKSLLVNESIQIIGRDDFQMRRNRKSLKELVESLDKTLPIILLDHEPFNLNEAEENGIDLQFSGHTHNGQIFPGNLIVKQIFELPYGYLKKGNTHYYVSSGLGLWGPPFRIGTQSEVVVFNIEFN